MQWGRVGWAEPETGASLCETSGDQCGGPPISQARDTAGGNMGGDAEFRPCDSNIDPIWIHPEPSTQTAIELTLLSLLHTTLSLVCLLHSVSHLSHPYTVLKWPILR